MVTEEGITEQGQHEELIAAGGLYSQLHKAQFGFYENGNVKREKIVDSRPHLSPAPST